MGSLNLPSPPFFYQYPTRFIIFQTSGEQKEPPPGYRWLILHGGCNHITGTDTVLDIGTDLNAGYPWDARVGYIPSNAPSGAYPIPNNGASAQVPVHPPAAAADYAGATIDGLRMPASTVYIVRGGSKLRGSFGANGLIAVVVLEFPEYGESNAPPSVSSPSPLGQSKPVM